MSDIGDRILTGLGVSVLIAVIVFPIRRELEVIAKYIIFVIRIEALIKSIRRLTVWSWDLDKNVELRFKQLEQVVMGIPQVADYATRDVITVQVGSNAKKMFGRSFLLYVAKGLGKLVTIIPFLVKLLSVSSLKIDVINNGGRVYQTPIHRIHKLEQIKSAPDSIIMVHSREVKDKMEHFVEFSRDGIGPARGGGPPYLKKYIDDAIEEREELLRRIKQLEPVALANFIFYAKSMDFSLGYRYCVVVKDRENFPQMRTPQPKELENLPQTDEEFDSLMLLHVNYVCRKIAVVLHYNLIHVVAGAAFAGLSSISDGEDRCSYVGPVAEPEISKIFVTMPGLIEQDYYPSKDVLGARTIFIPSYSKGGMEASTKASNEHLSYLATKCHLALLHKSNYNIVNYKGSWQSLIRGLKQSIKVLDDSVRSSEIHEEGWLIPSREDLRFSFLNFYKRYSLGIPCTFLQHKLQYNGMSMLVLNNEINLDDGTVEVLLLMLLANQLTSKTDLTFARGMTGSIRIDGSMGSERVITMDMNRAMKQVFGDEISEHALENMISVLIGLAVGCNGSARIVGAGNHYIFVYMLFMGLSSYNPSTEFEGYDLQVDRQELGRFKRAYSAALIADLLPKLFTNSGRSMDQYDLVIKLDSFLNFNYVFEDPEEDIVELDGKFIVLEDGHVPSPWRQQMPKSFTRRRLERRTQEDVEYDALIEEA